MVPMSVLPVEAMLPCMRTAPPGGSPASRQIRLPNPARRARLPRDARGAAGPLDGMRSAECLDRLIRRFDGMQW